MKLIATIKQKDINKDFVPEKRERTERESARAVIFDRDLLILKEAKYLLDKE